MSDDRLVAELTDVFSQMERNLTMVKEAANIILDARTYQDSLTSRVVGLARYAEPLSLRSDTPVDPPQQPYVPQTPEFAHLIPPPPLTDMVQESWSETLARVTRDVPGMSEVPIAKVATR